MYKKLKIVFFLLFLVLGFFGSKYSIEHTKNNPNIEKLISTGSTDFQLEKNTNNIEISDISEIETYKENKSVNNEINLAINNSSEVIEKSDNATDKKNDNTEQENKKLETVSVKENNVQDIKVTNISLSKNLINQYKNYLIEIFSSEKFDNIIIGEKKFKISYDENQEKYYFGLSKDDLKNGEYKVSFSKNNEIYLSNIKFNVNIQNSSLGIINITPNSIKNDVDRYITVQGNGFEKIMTIQLSNNIILQNTTFTVVNDSVMLIKIPKDISEGSYYFNIMTTDSIHNLNSIKFNITN